MKKLPTLQGVKNASMRPRPTPTQQPRKRIESQLVADILVAVGARPDVLLARINTGLYAAPHDPKRRIRSAPTGYPDIPLTQLRRVLTRRTVETNFSRYEGPEFWHEYGQTIFIETKRPKTKDGRAGALSQEQKDFRTAAERAGAIYIAPTTVQEVLDLLGPVPEWVRGPEWAK